MKISKQRWELVGLALIMLMPSLETSIANASLPTLASAFAASFQQAQWIVLSYLLAITTLVVSIGRLSDIFGRRRLLIAGILTFLAASFAAGMAPSLGFLISARVAQGAGAAAMMALSVAFIGDIVPKEKTGRAMGLLGTMSAIGTSLGPSLGGILISEVGWRAIFFVNIPLAILSLVLVTNFLPRDTVTATADRPKLDGVGTVLLASALLTYALAMTLGKGNLGPINFYLLMVSVGTGVLFIIAQSRTVSPLLKIEMFRNPILSSSLAMSVLVSTVMMATLVVGPFYLSLGLRLEAATTGLALSVGPIIAALTGVPAGKNVDRFGAKKMTLIGLVAILAGCSALSFVSLDFGLVGYIGPIIVTTSGYALFQAANNTLVMSTIPQDRRGTVSGMLNLSRNLGLITGASVMGAIFATATAASDLATADPLRIASGARTTFLVGGTLIVMAIIIASVARLAAKSLDSRQGGKP